MLKIDQFYQDDKLGRLKFKGYDQGKLLFTNYTYGFNRWEGMDLTLDPKLNKTRIENLKPSGPPA